MIKFVMLIFQFLFTILLYIQVNADSPPPTWSKVYYSQNNKYALVAFSPFRENLDEYTKSVRESWLILKPSNQKLKILERKLQEDLLNERNIRNSYPTSGLYLTNDKQNPLWKIDWYEIWGNAFVTNGGYVIRFNPKVEAVERKDKVRSPDLKQVVLYFYFNGIEIHSYKLFELIRDDSELKGTSGGYYWANENKDSSSVNDEESEFTITKITGEKIHFGINDGELTSYNITKNSETKNLQPPENADNPILCFGTVLFLTIVLVYVRHL